MTTTNEHLMLETFAENHLKPQSIERSDTLGNQVYRYLCSAIRAGSLAPGQKLTTRSVALSFGVSPTPAREALNRLVAQSILRYGDNRIAEVPLLTRASYEEFMAMRCRLETLAAEVAFPRLVHRRSELSRIHALQSESHKTGDIRTVLRHNEQFHFAIYRRAEMPTLLQFIEMLWLQVGPSLNLLYPEYRESWLGGENHERMLNALAARDMTAFCDALLKDLLDGRDRVLAVLKQQEGP